MDPLDRRYSEGYIAGLSEASRLLRETSRHEIENKPGDLAYPLGAVGRWFRGIASRSRRDAENERERVLRATTTI